MISPKQFCDVLNGQGLNHFYGVPDSLLKNLCAYIDNSFGADFHVITANEGNAVGLAAGHYIGSAQPAVVYMQNSGLGNAVNPLTSLADPAVYSIPMLLIIGWRGEPGVKDEPQHIKQGEITEQQLEVLGIPYVVIDAFSSLEHSLLPLLSKMHECSCPVAILVRKDTFADEGKVAASHSQYPMSREQVLASLVGRTTGDELIISTTGMTSRELYEIRQANNQKNTDFLTVGAMGHTLSIAMGVARVNPNRTVIALDGDGSMLMHMGSLAVVGASNLENLIHVVLNNQCHDSVGGQPTIAGAIDLERIVLGCGYKAYFRCEDATSLNAVWSQVLKDKVKYNGPVLFEVKIKKGARSDLGRPTSTPKENKVAFMQHASGE